MTDRFAHRDLDGAINKLLEDGRILQVIDPNDGQSFDPADKCRDQLTLIDGVLMHRRLPPESVGDCWRGQAQPPEWQPTHEWPWPLVREWVAWRRIAGATE